MIKVVIISISHVVYTAIEEMVKKNPTSVFTYEYLLSACDTIADPRILNTIYYHATQNIQDNAYIYMQYAEFLEEMDEYDAARDMFYQAYKITPTDDLARSIIRVRLKRRCECRWILNWKITRQQERYWMF